MATTIVTKNSATSGSAPSAGALSQGELAVNVADKRLFTKDAGGSVVEVGTNPGGAVTFTAGSAAAPAITTTGDTNTGIFFPAADTIAFAEGGAEAMRIDASGNLGLGVTPSAWASGNFAIQLGGTGSVARFAGSGTAAGFSNNFYVDSVGTARYISSSNAHNYIQSASIGHGWFTAPSGTAGNAITFTQAMTLDASGRLGIGTSSPGQKLTVGVSADGSNYLQVNASSTIGYFGVDSNGVYVGSDTAAKSVNFYTAGTERMRIDSSGNLGIGTTSPSQRLEISSATGPTFRLNNSDTSILSGDRIGRIEMYANDASGGGTGVAAYIDALANTDFVGNFTPTNLTFATGSNSANATERMRIDASGNLLVGRTSGSGARLDVTNATEVGAFQNTSGTGNVRFLNSGGSTIGYIQWSGSTTSYVTSSDYRLKENIAPMTGALAKIQALKPVTYKWKVDGSDGQGFIAHELAEVVPDCVRGEKDGIDEEGNPKYQGIDTSFLVATLTAAIQEQQAIITQLQADVATLKGTV
jgi:hypothetical protein